MAKAKTAYVCSECGASYNKWQGQCGECGAWNTLAEIVVEPVGGVKANPRGSWAGDAGPARITPLAEVGLDAEARISTGIGRYRRDAGLR